MRNFRFIAEIGSNWAGNEKIAQKMIRSAKLAGADYVKFQMWRAGDLFNKSDPYWQLTRKSEITPIVAKNFKRFADSLNITCFWSVFYPQAVDILENLDVKLYKIASWTASEGHPYALETMEKVAKTKKPVIISMGLGGNVNKIKKIFRNNKTYFLYCIAKYPTSIREINFTAMTKYNGFSDHTMDHLAPLIYAIMTKNSDKIKFLEKHVSIKESKGQDKPNSIDMNDFKRMVAEINVIQQLKI